MQIFNNLILFVIYIPQICFLKRCCWEKDLQAAYLSISKLCHRIGFLQAELGLIEHVDYQCQAL